MPAGSAAPGIDDLFHRARTPPIAERNDACKSDGVKQRPQARTPGDTRPTCAVGRRQHGDARVQRLLYRDGVVRVADSIGDDDIRGDAAEQLHDAKGFRTVGDDVDARAEIVLGYAFVCRGDFRAFIDDADVEGLNPISAYAFAEAAGQVSQQRRFAATGRRYDEGGADAAPSVDDVRQYIFRTSGHRPRDADHE